MAGVLYKEYGYNTRAAGHSEEYALVVVDDVLLGWANEVVCANAEVAKWLCVRFPELASDPRLVTLDLPDMYEWNDPELVKAIIEQYAPYVG